MRNTEDIINRIEQLEAERSEIMCNLHIQFRTRKIEKVTKELEELEAKLTQQMIEA